MGGSNLNSSNDGVNVVVIAPRLKQVRRKRVSNKGDVDEYLSLVK